MARYDKTKKLRKNLRSYYGTTIYKKVNEKNSDAYFVALKTLKGFKNGYQSKNIWDSNFR